MKSKIKILIVSCVIAAAAVTGINMAQNNSNMDVTLADIAVMAKADGESGGTHDYKMFTYSCHVGPPCVVAWWKRCEPYPGEQCNVSDQHTCGCPVET